MLQVWAVERGGIEEDGHGVVERDAVFAALASAFRGSHSNTNLVYRNSGRDWTMGVTRTSAHRVVHCKFTSPVFVSELCHILPETPGNDAPEKRS